LTDRNDEREKGNAGSHTRYASKQISPLFSGREQIPYYAADQNRQIAAPGGNGNE
jgi:hypothetical protein